MKIDEKNIGVDESFKMVFEFGFISENHPDDFYVYYLEDDKSESYRKFEIGSKSFCIEGFSYGENAGRIRIRIEK